MKRRKYIFPITAVSIAVFLIFCAFKITYWVAETYFFDKFFYQKSLAHGYYTTKGEEYAKLDSRSTDILLLEKLQMERNKNNDKKVLGVKKEENTIYVAIFGDSFTWGQGIRHQDTFPSIVKKELSVNENVKIISLAFPGDQIQDKLMRYKMAEQVIDIDIAIFALTLGDEYPQEHKQDIDGIRQYCKEAYPGEELIFEPLGIAGFGSLPNATKINFCILEQSLSRLPTKNAVYFLINDFSGNDPMWTPYKKVLTSQGKNFISSSAGRSLRGYQKYFEQDNHQNFFVSKKDPHPSKLAHKMYAGILLNEILQLINSYQK